MAKTTRGRTVWKYSVMPFIVFVVILALLAHPVGFPINVTPMTKEVYNYLQELNPGDLVCFFAEPFAGSIDPASAVVHYLWTHDINLVAWSPTPMSYSLTWDVLRRSGITDESLHPDYKYGENWVYLGLIPGIEATMTLARDNFQALTESDYQGTPIADLPLLQGVTDVHSFKMLFSAGETQEYHAKLWPLTLGVTSIIAVPTDAFPNALVYYHTSFSAILNGLQGSGELEILMGWPARGIVASDALSGSVLVTIAVVIIAQVEVMLGRGKEKETIKKEM